MADTRLPAAATASVHGRIASLDRSASRAATQPVRNPDTAGRAASLRSSSVARSAAFVVALCLTLGACKADDAPVAQGVALSPAASVQVDPAPVAAAAAVSAVPTAAAPAAATARILSLYAAPDGGDWAVWDTLEGVTWNDPSPVPTPDAMDAADAKWRSGRFQWRFATSPPSERDRDVGLTLIGAATVESVSLRRFRPATEYGEALRSQFDGPLDITQIAANCAGEPGTASANGRDTAFFALRGLGAATLYAEAYVDREAGKSGPGYTTYTFTRDAPRARMQALRCANV